MMSIPLLDVAFAHDVVDAIVVAASVDVVVDDDANVVATVIAISITMRLFLPLLLLML